MSRYQREQGIEGEFEPGSHKRVLRNKRGIVRKRDIDVAEYEALVLAQEKQYQTITAETQFTPQLLCAIHRDWLGDIYEWAGIYRTVEMSKEGFTWPPAYLVPQNMAQFGAGLLQENTPCPPDAVEVVAYKIAIVHSELLLIHPFRDGNGRIARLLANLMAAQAGFPPLDYGFEGRGSRAKRANYLRSVVRGYGGNFASLTAFFVESITRSERGETNLAERNPLAPSKRED